MNRKYKLERVSHDDDPRAVLAYMCRMNASQLAHYAVYIAHIQGVGQRKFVESVWPYVSQERVVVPASQVYRLVKR